MFVLFPRKKTALFDALLKNEAEDETVVEWGLSEQLLAGIFDSINFLMWSLGDGKNNKPSPIPRPGVESEDDSNTKRYKGKLISVNEARERLQKMINKQ